MGLSWDPGLLPGHRAWGFRFGQGFGAAGVKQLSTNNVTRSFEIRALGFRFRLQPETCKVLRASQSHWSMWVSLRTGEWSHMS